MIIGPEFLWLNQGYKYCDQVRVIVSNIGVLTLSDFVFKEISDCGYFLFLPSKLVYTNVYDMLYFEKRNTFFKPYHLPYYLLETTS